MKGIVDNKKVNENHQGGIERVKQRPGEMDKGYRSGKMGEHKGHANWKRPNSASTPRPA